MNVAEKIYYTWLLIIIPLSMCWWMLDISETKHPILVNFICAFIFLPIAIGLVAAFVWVIVQVWQG